MSWQKFTDRARESKKVRRASSDAIVLWWAAGNYCSEHNSDGFIAKDDLPDAWRPIGRKFDHAKVALECEDKKLFIDHGDYYEVKDYLEFNPSKEDMEEKKKKDAKRAKAYRDRQKTLKKLGIVTRDDARDEPRDGTSDATDDDTSDAERTERVTNAVTPTVRHAPPTRPVPIPTRPDTEERENARALAGMDSAEQRAAKFTSALRIAFAERYHAARGLTWNRAGDPAVENIGGWLSRNVRDEEMDAAIARVLERFFADKYVVDRDFPVGLLDKQVSRLLEPPKAVRDVRKGFCDPSPPSAFNNPTDLDKVFGPEKPAAGGAHR